EFQRDAFPDACSRSRHQSFLARQSSLNAHCSPPLGRTTRFIVSIAEFLTRHPSAIHRYDGAVDVIGSTRCQIHRRTLHIFGSAEALTGNTLKEEIAPCCIRLQNLGFLRLY